VERVESDVLSPLITWPDGRPGLRGFHGKTFIKTDGQIPQGLIGRCACDVCHHHEPEIRPRPEHRNGEIHCVRSSMSYYRLRRPILGDLSPAERISSGLWRARRRVFTHAGSDQGFVEFFHDVRRNQGGGRLPSPACQATHFAKSRTDMCIVPAGPIMSGLSPFGPASIALGLPSTIRWPSGASTFPRLACGPKPALFKPKLPKPPLWINPATPPVAHPPPWTQRPAFGSASRFSVRVVTSDTKGRKLLHLPRANPAEERQQCVVELLWPL
jgi:hypothetical protein